MFLVILRKCWCRRRPDFWEDRWNSREGVKIQKRPGISRFPKKETEDIQAALNLNDIFMSAFFRKLKEKPVSILPAEAGICDGTDGNHMIVDILASFQKITLYHYAFYQFSQIRIIFPAVKDFTDNTDLFLILFVRIGMVYIYDHGRISQIPSGIKFSQTAMIVIMIIWTSL